MNVRKQLLLTEAEPEIYIYIYNIPKGLVQSIDFGYLVYCRSLPQQGHALLRGPAMDPGHLL